jgi:plasmid stability protein
MIGITTFPVDKTAALEVFQATHSHSKEEEAEAITKLIRSKVTPEHIV